MAIPQVDTGPTGNDGAVAGFDLDGNGVDECRLGRPPAELAGLAPGDPAGVDASLDAMLSGLIGDAFQGPINGGSLLTLVDLTDVDDPANDANITLTLYVGRLRPGVREPTLVGGRIAPGQTFEVDPASLQNGQPLFRWPGSRITAGRVRTPRSGITFPLDQAIAGFTLRFRLRRAQIAFTLSADGTALSNGLLGGAVAPLDLQEALCCGGAPCRVIGGVTDRCCTNAEMPGNPALCANDVQGLPLPASSIVGLIQGAADLAPDPSGMCTEASISYSFDGVSAVF